MTFDVVIVGGGPGGLAAALTLGRARKRVLLCDRGPRRNAAATHVHNFVTRDGTPPDEMRRVARAQLAAYPNVEVRDVHVDSIHGARGAFEVQVGEDAIVARRIVLCTGMIDQLPALPGLAEVWGTAALICPYCHGWEVQDRRFGYLATSVEMLGFPLLLRGWAQEVTVFTNGALDVPADQRARLDSASVPIEERRVVGLVVEHGQLRAIELADGTRVARDVLFLHPKQDQVALVTALGVALDEHGYVRVDAMTGETSVPGIYAGGDLTTLRQTAIFAAAAGVMAAAALNHELTAELVMRSATPPA